MYAAQRERSTASDGASRDAESTRHKPGVAAYTCGVSHIPRGLFEFEKKTIVRIFGSIAYDLYQVTTGTLNAVIDTRGRLNSYEIAAAQLALRESGRPRPSALPGVEESSG